MQAFRKELFVPHTLKVKKGTQGKDREMDIIIPDITTDDKDFDDAVRNATPTERIVELIKEGLPKLGELVGDEKTTIEVICQQVRRHLPETQELIGVIQQGDVWEILLKEK